MQKRINIKVAIIDYGLGNLFSISQACNKVGLTPIITNNNKVILNADALILPGVGAFGHAMKCLRKSQLVEPLLEFANSGKPFMGICLGMQLLFSESQEFELNKGLNIIDGKIISFPNENKNGVRIKKPQIQWNNIKKNSVKTWINTPLDRTKESSLMYFVHSFYCEPKNKSNILSYTNYMGINYASAVIKNNIVGFQFHPEKSGKDGIEIYSSWANQIIKH